MTTISSFLRSFNLSPNASTAELNRSVYRQKRALLGIVPAVLASLKSELAVTRHGLERRIGVDLRDPR